MNRAADRSTRFRARRGTGRLLRTNEFAAACGVRGLPSLVKGAGLRILSRRGSQVQILPHASFRIGLLSEAPTNPIPPTRGEWPMVVFRHRAGGDLVNEN